MKHAHKSAPVPGSAAASSWRQRSGSRGTAMLQQTLYGAGKARQSPARGLEDSSAGGAQVVPYATKWSAAASY